jgi:hypothetical protein
MKPFVVPVDFFDFDGFIKATYAFIRDRFREPDPSLWIQAMEPDSDFPEDMDCRDVGQDLEKGLALFVPFALPDMTGGTVCAYGRDYATWRTLEEEGVVPEEQEYLVDDINELGYIVYLNKDRYVIRTAKLFGGLSAGPMPYLEEQENMGLFEGAMTGFLRQFVRFQKE